ncbi:hypothetical protein F4808DRAFT_466177 [Astrocystis sublimbata]|nr:hypothetical protein F4808DRAFT_466177 [Astrocystis sublimbata]
MPNAKSSRNERKPRDQNPLGPTNKDNSKISKPNFRRDNISLRRTMIRKKLLIKGQDSPASPLSPVADLQNKPVFQPYALFVPVGVENYERACFIFDRLALTPINSPCTQMIAKSNEEEAATAGALKLKHCEESWELKLCIGPHVYPGHPKLHAADLQILHQGLHRDIDTLYNARLPYIINVLRDFRIAHVYSDEYKRLVYRPVIWRFDPTKDPRDENLDWAALKAQAHKHAERQFDVLEALHCHFYGLKFTSICVPLDPDVAVGVLQSRSWTPKQMHLTQRQIERYSPRLGQAVTAWAAAFLQCLPKREWSDSPSDRAFYKTTTQYVLSVWHIIKLAYSQMNGKYFYTHVFPPADQVALLATYTALLVHFYAKVIPDPRSVNLLGLPGEGAWLYRGIEEFQQVRCYRRHLARALDSVAKTGGIISPAIRIYLQDKDSLRSGHFYSAQELSRRVFRDSPRHEHRAEELEKILNFEQAELEQTLDFQPQQAELEQTVELALAQAESPEEIDLEVHELSPILKFLQHKDGASPR